MDILEAHATTVHGSGAPTIVLAHGLGGDQHQWDPIAAALAQRTRVVTYDLAGSGAADPTTYSPIRHASVMGFADDLAGICGALGLRGACYVGHSVSAAAGVLAAVADPGLFSRMVLIGASACYLDDPDHDYAGGFTLQGVSGLLDAVQADFDLWSAGFAPHMMQNAHRPELARAFTDSLRRYRPDRALTVFRAAFTSDIRRHVPQLRVPTLMVQATDDPAVPLTAATWMATHLPDATLQMVPIAGHFPHVAEPDTVLALIEPFLLGDEPR